MIARLRKITPLWRLFFRKLNETKITTPLGLEKSLKLEANSGNVDICGEGNATLSYTKDL